MAFKMVIPSQSLILVIELNWCYDNQSVSVAAFIIGAHHHQWSRVSARPESALDSSLTLKVLEQATWKFSSDQKTKLLTFRSYYQK